jgi:hypothetical protein
MDYLASAFSSAFGRIEPTAMVEIPTEPEPVAHDIAELPSPKGLYSLPTSVLEWIEETFTIEACPDGPNLCVSVKPRSKNTPKTQLNIILWALSKLDTAFMLDLRNCKCYERCKCKHPHGDDATPMCEGFCHLPEHLAYHEFPDSVCRLYLIIAASRTSCADVTHEQWYDLILNCPAEGLACLYANKYEIFRVRSRYVQVCDDKAYSRHAMGPHMRHQGYAVAQFFHERGVIDAPAQVLALGMKDLHNNRYDSILKFFESTSKTIDELIAGELACIRYARPQYYTECKVGVIFDGADFGTIYDLEVLVDLLQFAQDNALLVDTSAISTHLRLWAKAPFCIEHLTKLRSLGVALPPRLHQQVVAVCYDCCEYDCCGGTQTPDLTRVDDSDLELVMLQSDSCRGRCYDAMIANRGDIINAIMDLTM